MGILQVIKKAMSKVEEVSKYVKTLHAYGLIAENLYLCEECFTALLDDVKVYHNVINFQYAGHKVVIGPCTLCLEKEMEC